jgi:hypothetical protein
MKINSYILFDKQAKKFNTPMFLENDAVAIRTIKNELMNPNSQISLSPDDFAIYTNGIYDDSNGEFTYRDEQNTNGNIINPLKIIEVSEIQLPNTKEVK